MKWTVETSNFPGLYDVYDEDGNRVVRHTTHDRACFIARAPDLLAENERLRTALDVLFTILAHVDTVYETETGHTIEQDFAEDLDQARAALG